MPVRLIDFRPLVSWSISSQDLSAAGRRFHTNIVDGKNEKAWPLVNGRSRAIVMKFPPIHAGISRLESELSSLNIYLFKFSFMKDDDLCL